MAILPIVAHPHPALRQRAEETALSDEVRQLADDMMETMLAANGLGLAAPQVNKPARLIVADVTEDRSQPFKLLNPVIVSSEGSRRGEEGCLSVPGMRAPVQRAQFVVARGIDMNGNEQTIEASDLLAVCLQHEIDHLNGVLFFDHLSALRRRMLLDKYKKARRAANS